MLTPELWHKIWILSMLSSCFHQAQKSKTWKSAVYLIYTIFQGQQCDSSESEQHCGQVRVHGS